MSIPETWTEPRLDKKVPRSEDLGVWLWMVCGKELRSSWRVSEDWEDNERRKTAALQGLVWYAGWLLEEDRPPPKENFIRQLDGKRWNGKGWVE